MTSDLDYRAIRKRVEAGVSQQKFRVRLGLLIGYLIAFIALMITGWGIFLSTGGMEVSASMASGNSDSPLLGAMIVMSTIGFLGLMFQVIGLSLDTKRGEERIREQLVAKEINREMLRMGLDEPEENEKRKGMMRLTDDGELETIEDDTAGLNAEVPVKRQR